MKIINKEDIVTRRQFFKKAASIALPLMTAAVLPSVLTSCEIDDPVIYGCVNNCASSCSGSCGNGCGSSCATSNCTGNCYGSCKNTCLSSCGHACSSTSRRV